MEQRLANSVGAAKKRVEELLILQKNKEPGLVPKLQNYAPSKGDKREGNSYRDGTLYEKFDNLREWIGGVNEFVDSPQLEDLLTRMDHFAKKVRPMDPSQVRKLKATRDRVVRGLMRVLEEPKRVTKQAAKTGAAQFV